MKYSFIPLIIVLFTAVSCTKNGSLVSFSFNAKIESQLTNQSISGAKIYVKVVSIHGSGLLAYEILIDSFSVISDHNGNLSCNIKYNNDPNIVVKFYKEDDSYSTGFFPQKTEFLLSELKNMNQLTFYVRKFAPLQINVKNINPFDDNDAVEIWVFQDNTYYLNHIIDSVRNFRVTNQPWGYPASNDGKRPYWIGKDVNSIIYGKIQEGAIYQINWDVRRNGVNTDYHSSWLKTSTNSLNSYDILY